MRDPLTHNGLARGLNDGIAQVREWDDVQDQLAALGLDATAVHDLVRERWGMFDGLGEPHELFIRGFLEGLITGLKSGDASRREG